VFVNSRVCVSVCPIHSRTLLVCLECPFIAFTPERRSCYNTCPAPLPLAVVWIQLYRGDKALGFPIEIVEATRNVTHLTELVKGKRAVALHNFDAVDLAVYSPGIPWDALTDSNPLDPGGSVPGGTTKAQPLIVIAPGKCL
jgi:hypothetical protein